jgi:hypothetical protein
MSCGFYVKKTARDISLAVDWDPEAETFRTPNVVSRRDIVRFTLLTPAGKRRK